MIFGTFSGATDANLLQPSRKTALFLPNAENALVIKVKNQKISSTRWNSLSNEFAQAHALTPTATAQAVAAAAKPLKPAPRCECDSDHAPTLAARGSSSAAPAYEMHVA